MLILAPLAHRLELETEEVSVSALPPPEEECFFIAPIGDDGPPFGH
jgi:hypothetical protein